jgi:hypothetical protein
VPKILQLRIAVELSYTTFYIGFTQKATEFRIISSDGQRTPDPIQQSGRIERSGCWPSGSGFCAHTQAGKSTIRIEAVRMLRPHPRRKKHIQSQRLGMARWNVDQQSQNLPMRHGFEMLTHALDMPVTHERRRLDPAPGRLLVNSNNEPSQVRR